MRGFVFDLQRGETTLLLLLLCDYAKFDGNRGAKGGLNPTRRAPE